MTQTSPIPTHLADMPPYDNNETPSTQQMLRLLVENREQMTHTSTLARLMEPDSEQNSHQEIIAREILSIMDPLQTNNDDVLLEALMSFLKENHDMEFFANLCDLNLLTLDEKGFKRSPDTSINTNLSMYLESAKLDSDQAAVDLATDLMISVAKPVSEFVYGGEHSSDRAQYALVLAQNRYDMLLNAFILLENPNMFENDGKVTPLIPSRIAERRNALIAESQRDLL